MQETMSTCCLVHFVLILFVVVFSFIGVVWMRLINV